MCYCFIEAGVGLSEATKEISSLKSYAVECEIKPSSIDLAELGALAVEGAASMLVSERKRGLIENVVCQETGVLISRMFEGKEGDKVESVSI